MVPSVHMFERRAVSGGRVAASGGGSLALACAHGWPLWARFARRTGALALRFGAALEKCVHNPEAIAKLEGLSPGREALADRKHLDCAIEALP